MNKYYVVVWSRPGLEPKVYGSGRGELFDNIVNATRSMTRRMKGRGGVWTVCELTR